MMEGQSQKARKLSQMTQSQNKKALGSSRKGSALGGVLEAAEGLVTTVKPLQRSFKLEGSEEFADFMESGVES